MDAMCYVRDRLFEETGFSHRQDMPIVMAACGGTAGNRLRRHRCDRSVRRMRSHFPHKGKRRLNGRLKGGHRVRSRSRMCRVRMCWAGGRCSLTGSTF